MMMEMVMMVMMTITMMMMMMTMMMMMMMTTGKIDGDSGATKQPAVMQAATGRRWTQQTR